MFNSQAEIVHELPVQGASAREPIASKAFNTVYHGVGSSGWEMIIAFVIAVIARRFGFQKKSD